MSSHYINVSCSVDSCEKFEILYTGDLYLENFSDQAFEGETIYIPCLEHEGTDNND